jgi:hypothetical protein
MYMEILTQKEESVYKSDVRDEFMRICTEHLPWQMPTIGQLQLLREIRTCKN